MGQLISIISILFGAIDLFLFGAIGILLLGVVALKPKLFWSALIMAAVGGAGFMIKGYTFIDEYFIGCVLLGGLSSMSIGAVRLQKNKESIRDFLHRWIFFFLIAYMIIQSVRGILIWESLEKFRWVVYYGMLGLIVLMTTHKGFPVPSWRKISLIVSGSTLAYLILYLSHGLFTETVRGISRFEVQPGEWSTTAYALFPLVIAIPAAIFLINDRSYKYRWVGWTTLVAAILAALYYLSRVAWLVILAFLFISLFKLGFRKVIFFLLCFLLIFSLFFGVGSKIQLIEKGSGFFGELLRTVQSIRFWEGSTGIDIDRKVHLQVGFISIMEDWKSFLFGYGFRMNGLVISPHLKKLYEEKGFPELAAKVKDDEATEGFTALLVDTGMVGMLLLGTNFLFVAGKIIIRKKNPYRLLLLLSLVFTFLWLPVINMVDIMLFYLLIMPKGLLLQLSQYPANL